MHHLRSSLTVRALRWRYSGTTKPTPMPRVAAWETSVASAEALVGRSAATILTEEEEGEAVFACCWSSSCLPTAAVVVEAEREEEA